MRSRSLDVDHNKTKGDATAHLDHQLEHAAPNQGGITHLRRVPLLGIRYKRLAFQQQKSKRNTRFRLRHMENSLIHMMSKSPRLYARSAGAHVWPRPREPREKGKRLGAYPAAPQFTPISVSVFRCSSRLLKPCCHIFGHSSLYSYRCATSAHHQQMK